MKKIKRIFIILILSITLFTSSYSRVDAVAIPIGIGLKAILTYGLVTIAGLVAIDYQAEESADLAQRVYDEYTDVMDKELEEYAEETGRSDIYYDFKDNNYHKKNQPFIPDVKWTDDVKKLFKDFGENFRSKFQEFPTEYSFFGNYGTINQYLNSEETTNLRRVYEYFLDKKVGALFVFENISDDELLENEKFHFAYVYHDNIEILYTVDSSNPEMILRQANRFNNVYNAKFGDNSYLNNVSSFSFSTEDYELIDVWEYPDVNINSVIDLPENKTADELKQEGLLIGGNADIMVQDAEWVKDVKKKGKSIYDIDVTHLDGDMDADGNYIKNNVIPVIPDKVWIDAIEKKIPWDNLIQYPDIIIHDDDDVVVNTPDYPDDNKPDVYVPKNIDFGDNPEIVRTDLKMVFPFCIPFDLIDAIKLFNAPPKAPVFEIPVPMGQIGHETITIDMEQFESLAQIFRIFMTIMFIMSLIVITRQIIKG